MLCHVHFNTFQAWNGVKQFSYSFIPKVQYCRVVEVSRKLLNEKFGHIPCIPCIIIFCRSSGHFRFGCHNCISVLSLMCKNRKCLLPLSLSTKISTISNHLKRLYLYSLNTRFNFHSEIAFFTIFKPTNQKNIFFIIHSIQIVILIIIFSFNH